MEIKAHFDRTGQMPTDSINKNTKEVQSMGQFLVKVRLGIRNGKHFLLTPDRLAFLYSVFPDFQVNRDE